MTDVSPHSRPRGIDWRLLAGLLIVAGMLICAGCSVVQFARGEKRADVSAIQPGVGRAEAEAVVGPPVREWTSPTGVRYRTYEYDSGRPPRPGEAAAMVFMDIATVGLWELAWISMSEDEKYQRTTTRVVISYDHRDVILGIFDEFDELPPDGRSGPRRWER